MNDRNLQEELLSNESEKIILEENSRNVFCCSKCGANISSEEQLKECIYCKGELIINSSFKSNVKYNYIIPFRHNKIDALNKIKRYIKQKPLYPKEFNIKRNIQNLNCIYIQLWLFDFDASGEVEVNSNNISKFKSKNRKYVKTDSYLVTLGSNMSFIDVPVVVSKKINKTLFNLIEPYDYTKQEEFDSKYLTGRLLEEQTLKIKDIISLGENDVKDMFSKKMLSEVKEYDESIISECSINLRNKKKQCILLPLWILSVNYKGKVYDILLNDQTGKIAGKIPISWKKLLFKFILIFIFVFTVLFFSLNYKVIL